MALGASAVAHGLAMPLLGWAMSTPAGPPALPCDDCSQDGLPVDDALDRIACATACLQTAAGQLAAPAVWAKIENRHSYASAPAALPQEWRQLVEPAPPKA